MCNVSSAEISRRGRLKDTWAPAETDAWKQMLGL